MGQANIPIALTLAGLDPSGGAGLGADLKTFHHHGVYGASVATLITAQNTTEVARVEVLSVDLVLAQLDCLLADFTICASKTGALGSVAIARGIADRADRLGALVVDPIRFATHGATLSEGADVLFPVATLITPNAQEAAELLGREVRNEEQALGAARALRDRGAAVLLKGGHLDTREVVDILADAQGVEVFRAPRVPTPHTHGTGCALSAAVTARLAQGAPLRAAVRSARAFVARAIAGAPGLGAGNGPLDLFADQDETT